MLRRMITLLALATGCAACFGQEINQQSNVLSAAGGRYVFGQISPYSRDQYMLDTQTGRLWQIVCAVRSNDNKDCAATTLDWVPYTHPTKSERADRSIPPELPQQPARKPSM